MLTTIIVLPDGTEISSGKITDNAIQSCSYTECVNSGTELTLGSVCSAMIEVKLYTPGGGLQIAAGDELTIYKDDGYARHKLGIFIAEKPVRLSANTMKVTAYDRISLLDKDLTSWLSSLQSWPYSLHYLAQQVCRACGLELETTSFPNGSYLVQKFSADGVTGRQLIQWASEAAGRFCRATADGKAEFAWYEVVQGHAIDAAVVAGNTQQHFFFQGGLTFEDYTVAPIEKVQIRANEEDVGTIWPNDTEAVNTYQITGNMLLTATDAKVLQPVAQVLYEQLQSVSYTPCNVTILANTDIRAGHIVPITDRNGHTLTAYIMTRKQSGQKDTLECTGSHRRDSVTAVNEQAFKSLAGRVLNLRVDVEGIRAENREADGRFSKLELDVDGINTTVQQQTKDTQGLRTDLTSLQQTAQGLQVSVQSINDNGVSKVKTSTDYTFDEKGLKISKSGEQMENLLDNTGMYVTRSGDTVLQANSDGVVAVDVRVKNYLCIGENSRFEDYGTGRTACFYTGG